MPMPGPALVAVMTKVIKVIMVPISVQNQKPVIFRPHQPLQSTTVKPYTPYKFTTALVSKSYY